jgi:hypothetical protein
MSCWVVPTVAAEFWGVTIDVVWDRINCDLVPHKTERGFVFIDVDPWRPESTGRYMHEPPPTFVPAGGPDAYAPAMSATLLCEPPLNAQEDAFLSADVLSDDETVFLRDEEVDDDLVGADGDSEESEELPRLDDEEWATFGRLSWQEVRQSVGRTRRPPPRSA